MILSVPKVRFADPNGHLCHSLLGHSLRKEGALVVDIKNPLFRVAFPIRRNQMEVFPADGICNSSGLAECFRYSPSTLHTSKTLHFHSHKH